MPVDRWLIHAKKLVFTSEGAIMTCKGRILSNDYADGVVDFPVAGLITEESDADVVVVSEETGNISFVKGGGVTKIQNINELKLLLGESLG